MGQAPGWTQERRDWALARFAEGMSAAAIARGLGGGVSRAAVCGLVFRARVGQPAARRDCCAALSDGLLLRMLEMRAAGLGPSRIGTALRMDYRKVRACLDQLDADYQESEA